MKKHDKVCPKKKHNSIVGEMGIGGTGVDKMGIGETGTPHKREFVSFRLLWNFHKSCFAYSSE